MTSATDHVRRPRSRRGQGGRLREELIDAAEARLVATGSPDQVSLRRVAAEVGVTAPAIYRHFPDKETLLVAVVERRFATFRRHAAEAFAEADDPFEGFRRSARAYLTFAEQHPGHYQVLFGPWTNSADLGITSDERPHPGDAAMAELVARTQKVLDTGPGGQSLDASLIAVEIWSLLHGIADLRRCRPGFPWPPVERLVDGWIARLRNTAEHPPPS